MRYLVRMKRFVVVVGASLLGCAPAKLPSVNPPPPEPVVTPPELVPTPPLPVMTDGGHDGIAELVATPNPRRPLPTWDSVSSGHPTGATNPPYPVLIYATEPQECFKAWRGGMMPPAPDERKAGGFVVKTRVEALEIVRGGVQVACPEGEPARLLAAWAQKDAPPK